MKINIKAVIQDMDKCTVYSEDGTRYVFPIASEEAETIRKELPKLYAKQPCIVDLDVTEAVPLNDIAKQFEVVFMKLLEPLAETLGSTAILDAVTEVFKGTSLKGQENIIAKTKTGQVNNVEKMAKVIDNEIKNKQPKGVMNLISRLGNMDSNLVQNLLNFLERADLPIADNGDIIAYKALNRSKDHYVDIFSGKVKQRVGTRVYMPRDCVDSDGSCGCSVGLHIAARSYLSNFGGNVITLVRIKPEDVVSVPNEDVTKMRVCSYQILAELPTEGYELIKKNKPITTNTECQLLLQKALSEECPSPDCEVFLRKGDSSDIQVYFNNPETAPKITETARPVKSIKATDEEISKLSEEERKAIIQDIALASPRTFLKFIDHTLLMNHELSEEYLKRAYEIKRKLRKGWKNLGMSETAIKYLNEHKC